MVKVGDDKYLVGDLTKRLGGYRLEMDDEYNPDLFRREEGKVKNPYKKLEGYYMSFDSLSKVVKNAGETQVIGSSDNGYIVAIPGVSLGSLGQTYNPIGKIIFPLLQDGEKVSVEKIERYLHFP